MEAKKLDKVTLEEYLEIEQTTQIKHEYHDGTIYAMSGGTIEHGLISGNTFGEIKFALRKKGSDCKAINSEVKLHIQSLNKYVYPDVMVICGEMETADNESNAIVNPTVIVEVLSKSTESYDRGDKFFIYRQIDSLKEYILIDQYKAQVEVYQRQSDLWKIQRVTGIDNQFEIASLGISVNLKDIYENVHFK